MSNGYLPGNDLAFQDWYGNFVDYASLNQARLGLTEAQVTELQALRTSFEGVLTSYHNLRDQAKAASTVKSAKRTEAETAVRPIVAQLQTWPATTDQDRDRMRIPIRGMAMVPAGMETDDNKPHAVIDIRQKQRHVLRIENQSTTSTSKARPSGVVGAEIWRKIGEPPQSESDYELVDLSLKAVYTVEYPLSDGNKQAHYRLRWVNAKGEKGAWSDVESATIAA